MIFYYHSGYFSIHHFLAAKVTLLFTALLKFVQFKPVKNLTFINYWMRFL